MRPAERREPCFTLMELLVVMGLLSVLAGLGIGFLQRGDTSLDQVLSMLRAELRGAALTALLWEVAKHLFTWYLSKVSTIGSVYGSLTAIIIFLAWIFYSSAIFYFGAEVVYHLGRQWSRPVTPAAPARA